MWVARELAREGRRVGLDMEDWFSEDLPAEARRERPLRLLRSLERTLLQESAHRTCTSYAMAKTLSNTYDCAPPEVIYNAFPRQGRKSIDGLSKDRADRSVPSLHWFSQSIGPGRGLEELFAALPLLRREVEVHLRGRIDEAGKAWLRSMTPEQWRDRVFFHGLVPNDELCSRIAEHDIGLALERNEPRNKDLTISNKMLQYLTAGIPVVASGTAGQRDVATEAPGAVRLFAPGDAKDLAAALNAWLCPEALKQAKAAAIKAGETAFCWERFHPVLVKSVQRATAGALEEIVAGAVHA
jgi:glycosyltransferase involved in cell wall biosynthesis